MMLLRGAETLSQILRSGVQGDISPRADLFSSSFSSDERWFDTYRPAIPDGLPFPYVIVPQLGDVEDLFATVATYYPDQSPLTALVHILSAETSSLMALTPRAMMEDIGFKQQRYRRASLGAALGETMLTGLGVSDGSGGLLSYSAVRRTLAFTLCRSQQLYGEQFPVSRLAERWMRLRDITGLGYTRQMVDAVRRAHEVASDSVIPRSKWLESDASFYSAVHALVIGDDLDGNRIEATIADGYPDAAGFLRELSGVFDGRMRAFTRLVEIILTHSRGQEIDEIAVGYICNCILPSSFSHAGALVSLTQFFPAGLIWYGFFSALTKPSKTSSLSPGLLLKLERDLAESFSFEQRPRCDIALEELEVLSRTKMRSDLIKPTQQRALLVGLLPGVDVYTRIGNEADQSTERARRDTEISTMNERVAGLLQEALQMLKASSTSPDARISSPAAPRAKKRVR